MGATLSLAFVAGALAAFNPCGLALLPAYLGSFLEQRSGQNPVARGLKVGGAVTVGFVAVFGAFGLLVSLVALRLGSWLAVVTVIMGIALVVAGALSLANRSVSVALPRANLSVSGSTGGMISYGVVYATVSLSCTLPIFMAAVATSFDGSDGLASGIAAFLAYAFGMGAVMTTLALAVALFQDRAASRIRRISPYFPLISGAFLVLAGLYVTWYGWVEYQSFQGNLITSGPTVWVAQASAAISGWLGSVPVPALLAVAGATAITAALATRRQRRRSHLNVTGPASVPEQGAPESIRSQDRASADKE